MENGRFFPLGTQSSMTGRCRVIVKVLDDAVENVPAGKLSESEKRKLLNKLCGSIDDPTFVEPLEIP